MHLGGLSGKASGCTGIEKQLRTEEIEIELTLHKSKQMRLLRKSTQNEKTRNQADM